MEKRIIMKKAHNKRINKENYIFKHDFELNTEQNKKHSENNKASKKSKGINKNKILIIIIILIIAIIAFIIIRAKVTFFMNDELVLQIEPLERSFSILNNESATANFTITNRNFVQCSSFCQIYFYDLKDKKLIYYKNSTLKHNAKMFLEYNLTAKRNGEGQDLYSLEISCNNIKSLVCFSDEKKRQYTVLTSLNYNLTLNELEIKQTLKPVLEESLYELKKSKELFFLANDLVSRINTSTYHDNIKQELNKIEKELESLETNIDSSSKYYNEEKYILASDNFFKGSKERLSEIQSNITIIKNEIENIINLRNQIIYSILETNNLREKISKITNHHYSEYNKNHFFEIGNIEEAVGEIYKIYSLLLNDLPTNEQELSLAVERNNEILYGSIENYQNEMYEGLFLSLVSSVLIDTKKNETTNHSYYFENESYCEIITQKIDKIKLLNSMSLSSRRNDFNFTLDEENKSISDTELDYLKEELYQKALRQVEEFINNYNYSENFSLDSFNEKKIKILERIKNQKANNTYEYFILSSLDIDDRLKITFIDTTQYSSYIENYCKDDDFYDEVKNQSIEKYLRSDFSNITDKKINDVPLYFEYNTTVIKENVPICCTYGKCVSCCDTFECTKDITPLLYVHGHAFNEEHSPETTMAGFSDIQILLENEGYINAGRLDLGAQVDESNFGDWQRSERPVVVSASYYYTTYYSLGTYTITAQKSERIENYAIRLKEIINLIKFKTGSEKVDIVAHSMGGLVIRDYLYLFGDSDIGTIITINTPHNGISGNVEELCGVIGAKKECEDMYQDSIFLSKIKNSNMNKRKDMYVIRSLGCKMENNQFGDGIVTNASGYLSGANNIVFYGNCTDSLNTNLHTDVLEPDKYPFIYKWIRDVLKRNTTEYNFTN